jgi:elongation factor Ts
MANYTAADVKKLRELTQSGMMDCKNALVQTDGDFDAAVELLRIKGAKDVHKREGRTSSNGLIAIKDGLALELACETDFVAKNADFQSLADQIVDVALAGKADDADAARGLSLGSQSVAEAILDLSAKIGEKIELRRLARIEGNTSAYLHRRSADLPPQVGVLVGFTGDDADVARGVGMQIAAMRPMYVSRDEVPEEVIASERHIAEVKFREEGKPEQAIARIADGVVNKYFKENVLLEQESVQDQKKSVQEILSGTGVTITRFVRYEVGQN